MKLSSIPQLYRDLNRSLEILTVLSKYGLAGWIDRMDLDFAKGLLTNADGQKLAEVSFETRVRLAMEELGPTFIKLGQMLSTRADVIGAALATELSQLQTGVPADNADVIRELIEGELGSPVAQLFIEFDDTPLASASIGQVHRARLPNGERVVVKVQHADIERKVRLDADILTGLAQLAERVPEFKSYQPRETVAEFQRALLRELDFSREERNLIEFSGHFADDPSVRFPKPFPEYCTGRVLTMEFLDGVPLTDKAQLSARGIDLEKLARRGAGIFLDMIFDHSFYHADPHPGNLIILPGGVIGVLDCGMVGRLDERLREDVEDLLMAIANRDVPQLKTVVMRIGEVPPDLDQAGLQYDLAEFVSHYANQPLTRLDMSGALNEMTELLRRYHIRLPAPLAVLLKVLVMLEGTAKLLSPTLSLTEMIQPYQQKLIWRRFSPARQWQKIRRLLHEWEYLAEILPRNIIDILQQVQSGRFDVNLEHRGLEPSVNRLVVGMLSSALFLGSSMLLSHHVHPLIGEVSVPGLIGAATSVFLGLRLIYAIRNSGRLDRH